MPTINQIIARLSEPWPQYVQIKDEGTKRGLVPYINWTDQCRILDECAPGWCHEVVSVEEVAGHITTRVRLIIHGSDDIAHREGVGAVKLDDAAYGGPFTKSASKAIKRAAKLFGLGVYLEDKKNKPKNWEEARRLQGHPQKATDKATGKATTNTAATVPQSIKDIEAEYTRLRWTEGHIRAFEKEQMQLAEWGSEMLGLASEERRQIMLATLRQMEKPVNLSKSTFWETVLGAQISTEVGNRIVAYRTGEDGTTDWVKAIADLRQCIDFKRACFEERLNSAAVATVLKQNGGNYKQATDAVKRDFLNRAA